MSRHGGSWYARHRGQTYAPVWRACAFVNCPRGLFIATRSDARYCSAACRGNASAMRHGKTLRGTGVTGGSAQKYYRTVAA